MENESQEPQRSEQPSEQMQGGMESNPLNTQDSQAAEQEGNGNAAVMWTVIIIVVVVVALVAWWLM